MDHPKAVVVSVYKFNCLSFYGGTSKAIYSICAIKHWFPDFFRHKRLQNASITHAVS